MRFGSSRFLPALPLLLAAIGVAFAAVACGGSRPEAEAPLPETEPAPPPVAAPEGEAELELAEGVTAIELSCEEGAEERCDAVDQDCDGSIDEGCGGYGTGALQIALAWDEGADVDLRITGPEGEVLDASSPEVSSGGRLAKASQAECGVPGDRLEGAHWDQAPTGEYRIVARLVSPCEDRATTATVTVSYRGRVLGVANRTLSPGEDLAFGTLEIR